MRVVYYARPNGLDSALPTALALGEWAEVHLVLEVAPEHQNRGTFGPLPAGLSEGIHPSAWERMDSCVPPQIEAQLRRLAGFHLVIHHCHRAFYPGTILTAVRAASFVRSLRPDIVHFHDTWTRAAWTFPLLGRIPIVSSVHDAEEHPGDPQSRVQVVRRLAWRFVSHLVFYSDHCQRTYLGDRRLPRLSSSVIPFGAMQIFRAWEKRRVLEDGQMVLFFGRLSAYKGLRVLQEAMPLVADAIPGVRFLVAGSPVPGFEVPHFPTLPRSGRVELKTEFIPPDLLCELFQQAALVVLPYTSATQSGVIMTAYAFSKPVVATRVGGLPEEVEDGVTGRLVPPDDPVALASALQELLLDREYRAQLSRNIGEKLRSHLSWQRVGEELASVYYSVIQRHQSR